MPASAKPVFVMAGPIVEYRGNRRAAEAGRVPSAEFAHGQAAAGPHQGESIQVTDRVPSGGERDGEVDGPGRPNATKIRASQPRTGAAPARSGAAGPKGGTPQPLTKAEKRALAKQRKARAIAARKRRQALLGALAGLGVVVVIVGAVLLIGNLKNDKGSTGASASASAGASAASPTPSQPFPPVPAGADPALSTKPTVATPSGDVPALKVTPLVTGTGAAVASGQTITVNYVGVSFKDGTEFDSSWKRSQAFTTPIGQGKVIPGWDQGLVGVKVGSRVQLDIPSNLAYGDNPTGGQPPGALRFVVDVLSAS
jgi:peptidylprolyl isomerase